MTSAPDTATWTTTSKASSASQEATASYASAEANVIVTPVEPGPDAIDSKLVLERILAELASLRKEVAEMRRESRSGGA